MRRILFVFLFFSAFVTCHAQIKWDPHWKDNSVQKLEYTYFIVIHNDDTIIKFDSTHCIIDVKFLGVNDSSYFLQWKFHDLYSDTLKSHYSDIEKWETQVYAKALEKCPFKFKIRKSDFKVYLTNKELVDSVLTLVINEASKAPASKWTDPSASWMFIPSFKSIIEEYYDIYKKDGLVPDQKIDAKNGKERFSGLNTEGYSILDAKAAGYYKWQQKISIDMAKTTKPLMDMLISMDSTTKIEKGTAFKRPSLSQISTMDAEIIISKLDMLVTSFDMIKTNDGAHDGTRFKSSQRILIKVIK
jgi:hypothetical protein